MKKMLVFKKGQKMATTNEITQAEIQEHVARWCDCPVCRARVDITVAGDTQCKCCGHTFEAVEPE